MGALNPRWNDEYNDGILDQLFEKASKMAGEEFLSRVDYLAKGWLPAREIVLSAVEKRKEVEQGGRVIVFETFAPWKVSIAFSLFSSFSLFFRLGKKKGGTQVCQDDLYKNSVTRS